MASLTRLGFYKSPSERARAAWAPDGRHVLVSWEQSACVWDFSRPEAPPVVTADVGPDARRYAWSPSGTSCFFARKEVGNGPTTLILEEWRTADGSLVRSVSLQPGEGVPRLSVSPDSHAVMLHYFNGLPAPRLVVFG